MRTTKPNASVYLLVFSLAACRGDPAPTPPPVSPPPTSTRAPAPAKTAIVAGTESANASPTAERPAPQGAKTFAFDGDPANEGPLGFSFGRTGQGKTGTWIVLAAADAPSKGHVLAQIDSDGTDNRFPVAVASDLQFRDVRVRVKCKPVSGKVDQACGIVFRYQDENNYLVTRANALENNVRLYYVKDGSRRQLASYSGTIKSGIWHDYAVEARGDHVVVSWDGAKVLDHHDSTFTEAGRAGVWTKADSVTYFDDLTIEAQ